MDEDLQGILAMVVLLAVLASQIVRFRREPAGIVRQQIKWAGFGFAAGFLLILGAVILAAALGDDPSKYTPLMSLAVLLLFSSGMAIIALGLLIALLRFRLWEADTVITRSAAYAVVTLIVGVVWAASSDLVKLVITEVMGRRERGRRDNCGSDHRRRHISRLLNPPCWAGPAGTSVDRSTRSTMRRSGSRAGA